MSTAAEMKGNSIGTAAIAGAELVEREAELDPEEELQVNVEGIRGTGWWTRVGGHANMQTGDLPPTGKALSSCHNPEDSRCLRLSKFSERTSYERIHGLHAYIKKIGDLPISILFKAQRKHLLFAV
jgi:hypothetical protein